VAGLLLFHEATRVAGQIGAARRVDLGGGTRFEPVLFVDFSCQVRCCDHHSGSLVKLSLRLLHDYLKSSWYSHKKKALFGMNLYGQSSFSQSVDVVMSEKIFLARTVLDCECEHAFAKCLEALVSDG
jgi:hypothetical protein